MGFFSDLFGKKPQRSGDQGDAKDDPQGDEASKRIFFAPPNDPNMELAFVEARATFKYFWRELYWEYRRIIPAHSLSIVKVEFSQTFAGQPNPVVEFMWVSDIQFDGEVIRGVLINAPQRLTNVAEGDAVKLSVDQVKDWMIAMAGRTYGGFTVQALRAGMKPDERKAHDAAWGLDFGSPDDILVVYEQKEHPENLVEHPMSRNTRADWMNFVQEYPDDLNATDADGYTRLHHEAIAGNLSSIEILVANGADVRVRNRFGKTALDYAEGMGWAHLEGVLG